jgi:hypothetical protein
MVQEVVQQHDHGEDGGEQRTCDDAQHTRFQRLGIADNPRTRLGSASRARESSAISTVPLSGISSRM